MAVIEEPFVREVLRAAVMAPTSESMPVLTSYVAHDTPALIDIVKWSTLTLRPTGAEGQWMSTASRPGYDICRKVGQTATLT